MKIKKITAALHLLVLFASGASALDVRELPCFWFDSSDSSERNRYLDRERLFSTYSWAYSALSVNAYGATGSENIIPLPETDQWSELGSVEARDLKQGFHARAWFRKSEENAELVIAFRGTDTPWADFVNGNLVFVPYLFGRTQFDSAIDFTDSVIHESVGKGLAYDRLVFTGHSLGGGLAQYAQRFYDGAQAVVFDPSPNRGRLYSLFSEKLETHSVRVYEKGEILEIPRKLTDADMEWDWEPGKSGKSTIWMDFYADGFVDGHGIDDLAMSLIRVAASTGDPGAMSVIKQIENRLDQSRLPDLKCPNNRYRRELRMNEQDLVTQE